MSTTTISLRVESEELERIDRAAEEQRETRTDYILSWMPQHYGPTELDRREHLREEREQQLESLA